MKLSDFNYHLPRKLIAKYPLDHRSQSRLLCLNAMTGGITHRVFKNVLDVLNPNDLLVFNNTKVIPARLYGKKATGGKVELLLERIVSDKTALVMLKASKAPVLGSVICFDAAVQSIVKERAGQFFLLEFNTNVLECLDRYGEVPLPPYLERESTDMDRKRYQTVYAKYDGAVAAPTAGLHFDHALLEAIEKRGVNSAFVTLHVGAGTFQPVRLENIEEHQMHSEYIEVSQETCDAIHATKQVGGRVIAVGTTSVRSLESAASVGTMKPFQGDTDIFIYPGYTFKIVDAMITNFHLPESTLLMLISAFANREIILKTYEEAIAAQYRFFSYGDAMFIYKDLG